jgi:hypothetical protein
MQGKLLLTKHLNWDVFLPTPIDFLKHAFHFAAIFEGEDQIPWGDVPPAFYNSRVAEKSSSNSVLHPRFEIMLFIRAATILDNAVLDFGSSSFTGSELASGIFYIVFPHEHGTKREKLLAAVTGYTVSQLASVIEFLEPYRGCSSQKILEILNLDLVNDMRRNFGEGGEPYRIEEDQTPDIVAEGYYRSVMEERARKFGYSFDGY